ncbi:(d)CMP kinase [Actinocrinis puniceicyclus]|uniref:Cytidylate kinase n=1 Tax=Actinocrinis puniceicyclus TaxID=977794 RepID=A0A8J7WLQ9_9ACTN|nr:(d)CMP kinase [Actinocrinis puniceicyclus]MBS2964681.1 (d)CMP kinase [Actinocrinis puniceicyclus]
MSDKAIVVAVDGPSGSGKSSVSKGVARRLGLRYLDTGAQYRAMTWWMLRNGVDLADREAVAAACPKPVIVSGTDPDEPSITVDGTDVAAGIRTAEVTGAVSAVAGVQAVRDRLIELQRQIIAAALAQSAGVVAEGRDIADVVCPQADSKIFLTASPTARAARRSAELGAVVAGGSAGTLADLARRDAEDAKTTRPHEAAPGAIVVDATHLTLDQVIERVVELVETARG